MDKITHVVFHCIHPRFDVVVPLDDAWAFYESMARFNHAAHEYLADQARRRDDGIARYERGESTTRPEYFRTCYQRDHELVWAKTSSVEVAAVVWNGDPTRRSFATGYFVWDFEHLIHRLVRIGDGIHNPAWVGKRATQHYVQSHWTWGFNWETRAAIYRAEEKETVTT